MSEYIPIIDLNPDGVSDRTNSSSKRIAYELKSAFSAVGMAYLKNHGIPHDKVKGLMNVSESFFAQPLDVKATYNNENQYGKTTFPGFCSKTTAKLQPGYMSDGTIYEKREFFDFNSQDCIYPDDVCPQLRSSVVDLVTHFKPMATQMLKYLALSLDLPEESFTKYNQKQFEGTEKNPSFIRTQYYPALSADSDNLDIKSTMRMRPHTDFGIFTFTFLDEEVDGLEVEVNGKWLPVPCIPGTMLITAGNLLQRWTADRYIAALHRVTLGLRKDGSSPKRQSIGYYVHPDTGTIIKSEKYKPFEATADFFNQFHSYRNNNINGTCQLSVEEVRKLFLEKNDGPW